MDVRILEYMIAIEEEGSLIQAADKVHVSPSALSQSLSKLEQELGTSLFVRIDKRWHPTDAGKRYLKGAREMLQIKMDTYDRIQHLAGLKRNVIRMAISSQVSFLYRDSILSTLRERFPDIRLELHPADTNLAQKYLNNNIVDAAILCTSTASNSLIDYYTLYTEHLVLAVPTGLAWEGKDIDYEHVRRLPFVMPTEKSFLYTLANRMLAEKKLVVNALYTAEDIEGLHTLVAHGYGSAFLPSHRARNPSFYQVYEWPNAPTYTIAYATSRYGAKKEPLMKLLEVVKECLAPVSAFR